MSFESSYQLPALPRPAATSWLLRADVRRAITAALAVALAGPALVVLYAVVRDMALPTRLFVILVVASVVGGALTALPFLWRLRSRQTPELPNVLGSYRLERRLGTGGMGEVWKARHALLARPAAVKLIVSPSASRGARLGSLVEGPAALLARFEREVQATASLQSPHTVRVFDFGRAADGHFYYVMELLEGLDAQTLVDHYGSMGAGRTIHLLKQACRSLDEAHSRGLIHRDIKPANLFVSRLGLDDDFVKVLDFGLVKLAPGTAPDDAGLTADGVTTGTPAFMAPEVALGRPDADHRLDIYSLGCVAYWLLTGQTVFDGTDTMGVALRHVHEPAVAPSRRSELPIPPELDALVLRCLAKDPADRPQTARELHALLEACPVELPWDRHRARQWWDKHPR